MDPRRPHPPNPDPLELTLTWTRAVPSTQRGGAGALGSADCEVRKRWRLALVRAPITYRQPLCVSPWPPWVCAGGCGGEETFWLIDLGELGEGASGSSALRGEGVPWQRRGAEGPAGHEGLVFPGTYELGGEVRHAFGGGE